ncbi:MAG: hypothetical protein L3V56_03045 [Candidatus Magnetoovum sp. WYHC-5]|nr:hypothetical protein [Candidatus Magnetoovum sp. WYHC-5]
MKNKKLVEEWLIRARSSLEIANMEKVSSKIIYEDRYTKKIRVNTEVRPCVVDV